MSRLTDLPDSDEAVYRAVRDLQHLVDIALSGPGRELPGVTVDELRVRLFVEPGDLRGLDRIQNALLRLERRGYIRRLAGTSPTEWRRCVPAPKPLDASSAS